MNDLYVCKRLEDLYNDDNLWRERDLSNVYIRFLYEIRVVHTAEEINSTVLWELRRKRNLSKANDLWNDKLHGSHNRLVNGLRFFLFFIVRWNNFRTVIKNYSQFERKLSSPFIRRRLQARCMVLNRDNFRCLGFRTRLGCCSVRKFLFFGTFAQTIFEN